MMSALKSNGLKGLKSVQIDVSKRHTLRGMKRCPSCGQYNGQRAQLCRNLNCEIRKNYRPYDPVSLSSSKAGTFIYSLRSKERDSQIRNFVIITDVTTLELEQDPAIVVSRDAVCFVEACRNLSSTQTNFTCKHIEACSGGGDGRISKAEVFQVTHNAIDMLNVNEEQKQQLRQTICAGGNAVAPPVQRLNASTFVVECEKSEVFPAGRLHVTAVSNTMSKKKGIYACACKKLKIIVEPDNSLVMQDEICEHLLLVLAAVLSKSDAKSAYGNFLDALQPFWLPAALSGETTRIQVESTLRDAPEDSFLGLNISHGAIDQAMSDELLICLFGNEYMSNEQLTTFAEEDAAKAVISYGSNVATGTDTHPYSSDKKLVSNFDKNEDDDEFRLDDNMEETTHLELTDCNIELMDQFQLTDQIDLNSDDITIPIDGEPINILSVPPVYTDSFATMPVVTTTVTDTAQSPQKQMPLLPLPPIELPTIAVVKKTPIKAADIATEVKTRKHPHVPTKRALIVNSNHSSAATQSNSNGNVSAVNHTTPAPALAYSAWLEFAIESLNESITPAAIPLKTVNCNFHIHNETFSHFCKSFSTGIKRRMPNEITMLKQGRHKGLTRFVWYLTSPQTVKRILTTPNISLQIERSFERDSVGNFILFKQHPIDHAETKPNTRRIYPRIQLYVAQMLFGCDQQSMDVDNVDDQKESHSLRVAWIPNVFPVSKFGQLSFEFTLKTRNPLIENKTIS